MDDYLMKYARPLEKLTIHNLRHSLLKWSDSLKEELEGILFLKGGISKEIIENKVKTKLKEIINKLEMIIVKEIEKIETVINDIDKFSIIDIDQNLFKSFEMIRENYNKILLNIQKMIASSTNLMLNKEKYNQSKTKEIVFSNSKLTNITKQTMNANPNELIDKLSNEIDILRKYDNNDKTIKEAPSVNKTISSSIGKSNSKNNNSIYRKQNTMKTNSDIRDKSPSTISRMKTFSSNNKKDSKLNTINDYDSMNRELEELNNNGNNNKVLEIKGENGKNDFALNILRNDMKDLVSVISKLSLRVESLEFENKQIKEENKNLYELINMNLAKNNNINQAPKDTSRTNNNETKIFGNKTPSNENKNDNKNNVSKSKINSHSNRNRNHSGSSPLSEISVFNTSQSNNPFENNACNSNPVNLKMDNNTNFKKTRQPQAQKRFYLEKRDEV